MDLLTRLFDIHEVPTDCLIVILSNLSDELKHICRLVSVGWNKIICEHIIFQRSCSPVYLDENKKTRVITSIRNIQFLLPLYTEPLTCMMGLLHRGRLLDNRIGSILWLSQFKHHIDIRKKIYFTLQEAANKGDILMVKSILTDCSVEPVVESNAEIINIHYKIDKIVCLLISHPRFKFEDVAHTTLEWACRNGCIETVKILADHRRIDVNKNQNRYLKLAISFGHESIVKLFLQNSRVYIKQNDSRFLLLAIQEDNLQMVKLLLSSKKINPNAENQLAIRDAVENGHYDIVKLFLQDKRINMFRNSNWMIKIAAESHREDMVRLLASDSKSHPGNLMREINLICRHCPAPDSKEAKTERLLRIARKMILSKKK